jgi:hypothetical protein
VPGKHKPVAVLQALPGAQSIWVFWQGKAHFWNGTLQRANPHAESF